MIFSKSFGYALRGILYIAAMRDEKRYVQVEEMGSKLSVPRYFMGKIMKKLAKEKILVSAKGPSGGFALNEHTLQMPLIDLIIVTDGSALFDACVLRKKECTPDNPCPMHVQMNNIKTSLKCILSETVIGDLLTDDKAKFIRSIAATAGITNMQKSIEFQKNDQ